MSGVQAIAVRLPGRSKLFTRLAWLARRPALTLSALVFLAWVVVAAAAPLLAPHNPITQGGPILHAPGGKYLFGTDELGRDVLSRVIYGARVSVPLAVLIVLAAALVGVTAGGVCSYVGGWLDTVVMRAADVVYSFPAIILAMAVTASLGPGLLNSMIALTIVSWPGFARVTRSFVLTYRGAEFVNASRLLGASTPHVLVRDIGPNIAGPLIVYAVLDVGRAILWLSALSFLGLGAPPPAAEWGAMISTGTQNFQDWWLSVFPGLAIFTVVAALNIAGEQIRQLLDPRARDTIGRVR